MFAGGILLLPMPRRANITTTSNLYTNVLPEVAHAAALNIAAAIPAHPRPIRTTPGEAALSPLLSRGDA